MIIVVTGADGFIGGPACDMFEREGHVVRRVTRTSDGPGAVRYVVDDIAVIGDWSHILVAADVVVHLAARAHIRSDNSADVQSAFRRTNVQATRQIAQQAAFLGVRRFVFLSSIGVNGSSTDGSAFVETDLPRPAELYAHSKLEAENVLKEIEARTGMEVVIVRPPLVYGPGAKGNLLRMLKLIASGIPLPLASLHNRRNLVGLDNLCSALRLCIHEQAAAGEVFLIAEPESHSTAEIFSAFYAALGMRNRLFCFPVPLLQSATRVMNLSEKICGSLEIDSSKARRLLRWRPETSFEAGVERTARWFREHSR